MLVSDAGMAAGSAARTVVPDVVSPLHQIRNRHEEMCEFLRQKFCERRNAHQRIQRHDKKLVTRLRLDRFSTEKPVSHTTDDNTTQLKQQSRSLNSAQ